MRRAVLLSAAAVLILVPGGTAFWMAFFPHQPAILPIGFWILWLLLSLAATLYAPVLVDRLTPEYGGNRECAIYARWGIALGIINVAWSTAEVLLTR